MSPSELIERAMSQGRNTLNEAESKELLAAYNIPVVAEKVVHRLEDIASAAAGIGFPLVIKGLGSKLTHKTEMGLVRLKLGDIGEASAAAREIADAAGPDLEGWLMQPYVSGRREFVAGLFRDDQFGPVVMFGLGGIFTEALDDVILRLAPLTETRALYMLGELKASSLLGDFRGEGAVDRKKTAQVLVGLSRLALEHPEVAEVDINPLLISPDGQPVAVDALVVLAEPGPKKETRPPVDPKRMGFLFHPRSVAFVGASANFRKWGNLLFTLTIAGGYEGDVYLVNPKGTPIAGRPTYKSVTDIPGPVDLAVVTVPAARVLDLIPEFQAKGIKSVVLVTSGFGETGEEGRRLEAELTARAREADILILGPNTMGMSNPHHKLYCTGFHTRPKPGSTAFVSQSGNMGVQLLGFAVQQGIGIRAFAGSGNEAILTVEDALDGFTVDELTRTVLLYIESVKDGHRFFESARAVSHKKPVVVLKGGRTKAGSRAAASHTGALASDARVFDAACRQAGIILADRPMDLLDLSAAFSSLPLPSGPRVAIMTLGGGWGVVTADLCQEFGLSIPDLSPELIAELDQLLPPYWSRSNPVDLVGENDPNLPIAALEKLMHWDGCDAVLNLGILGRITSLRQLVENTSKVNPNADRSELDAVLEFMIQYEKDYMDFAVKLMEETQKPVVGVQLFAGEDDQTVHDVEGSPYKGVFFPSPERAVKVLSEMWTYTGWLMREGVPREEWINRYK